MTRRYAIFISAMFCAFIGVFFAWNILSADREFSPNENRVLAQRPELSADSLLSGSFSSGYEAYTADQFVLRDGWVAAKAMMERAAGKCENNGIYFCAQDTLISRLDEPDAGQVAQNLGYVNALAEGLEIPVYFSLIPGKSSLWASRLPAGAPNASEALYLEQAMQTKARWVDIAAALNEHFNEDIFYRLDPHWSSLGAYYGYTALAKAMGLPPVPLDNYTHTTVSQSFTGTDYSGSGVRWLPPDDINIYVPGDGITVDRGEAGTAALYDWSKLQGKDQYAFFLGGNTPLSIIKTPHIRGEKLLIIRDSFADSLAPFLTAHSSELHLIDLRYSRASLAEYISHNGIDRVLVLYSVANFVKDTNLGKLAM